MGCQNQKDPQGTPSLNYFQMKNLPLREGKGLSRNQRETEPGQGHGQQSRSSAHSRDNIEPLWVFRTVLGAVCPPGATQCRLQSFSASVAHGPATVYPAGAREGAGCGSVGDVPGAWLEIGRASCRERV